MGQEQAIGLTHQCLIMAAQIAAPALTATLMVGVLVSIFQAATQIQEQSLVFVPKVVVLLAVLTASGGWMLIRAVEFARVLFMYLPNITK
jgi:flagellar biosynthesis protein FliQ